MSNKIKLGFVGGGNDSLIGVLHKVAAVMFDRYHLVGGVFSSNKDVNVKTADDLGLDQSRIYNDFEEMIDAEEFEDIAGEYHRLHKTTMDSIKRILGSLARA